MLCTVACVWCFLVLVVGWWYVVVCGCGAYLMLCEAPGVVREGGGPEKYNMGWVFETLPFLWTPRIIGKWGGLSYVYCLLCCPLSCVHCIKLPRTPTLK